MNIELSIQNMDEEIKNVADKKNYISDIENKIFINQLINTLTKEEQLIITLRYDLIANTTRTQIDVAHILQMPQSFVARTERKAIKKLIKICKTDQLI